MSSRTHPSSVGWITASWLASTISELECVNSSAHDRDRDDEPGDDVPESTQQDAAAHQRCSARFWATA